MTAPESSVTTGDQLLYPDPSTITNRGTSFTETETLLAAMHASDGDEEAAQEVRARIGAMLPNERRQLMAACLAVADACRIANGGADTRRARAGGVR